jgi:hypothetical protein
MTVTSTEIRRQQEEAEVMQQPVLVGLTFEPGDDDAATAFERAVFV